MPITNGREGDPAPAPALLRIGVAGGAHGLVGGLRVRLDNPESSALQAAARLFLEREGEQREYRVRGVTRINRNTVKVIVEGIVTPEAAAALRGSIVLIEEGELPPVGLDEFYYHRAIGCEVVTTGGRRIGIIQDIFATGANDVWVVRDGEREVLVPVIADVVKAIDIEHRRMTIEPVPGLLES